MRTAGVRRLCNKLGQRTPFYRAAWLKIFDAYFGGEARGHQVATHKRMQPDK